jgi:hypothetical protein
MKFTVRITMACLAMVGLLAGCTSSRVGMVEQDSTIRLTGYQPKSDDHYRILARLGPQSDAKEALVVIDKSKADGDFDTLVFDSDLDGDLGDEKVETFAMDSKRGFRKQFNVIAPFGKVDSEAKYGVYVRLYPSKEGAKPRMPFVIGYITLKEQDQEWHYMMIANTKSRRIGERPSDLLYSFGTPISMELKVDKKADKNGGDSLSTSTTMKDAASNVLRLIRIDKKQVKPHLLVTAPGGSKIFNESITYG